MSFPAFHAVAKREIVGGHSLLYTWEGSDPAAKPIALLAHQDVVPVAPGTEKDWQQPPFDGVIADGFIWGRGSWDDKGNLYSMLEAAEQMAKAGFRPKRTIYFAFGHDEEVSGQRGAKAIAALLASRGVKLDFVLDEGLLITDGIMKGLYKPAALIGVVVGLICLGIGVLRARTLPWWVGVLFFCGLLGAAGLQGAISLLPDYLLFIALFTVGVITLRQPAQVPAAKPQPVAA